MRCARCGSKNGQLLLPRPTRLCRFRERACFRAPPITQAFHGPIRAPKTPLSKCASGLILTRLREKHITSLREGWTKRGEGLDCLTAVCQPKIEVPTGSHFRGNARQLRIPLHVPWKGLLTRYQNKGERGGAEGGGIRSLERWWWRTRRHQAWRLGRGTRKTVD